MFLAGSPIVEVEAHAVGNSGRYSGDNVLASLRFANGSEGTISYLANGDRSFSKERLEIFGGGAVAVLEDFCRLELLRNGRKQVIRSRWRQDKGHRGEWAAFTRSRLMTLCVLLSPPCACRSPWQPASVSPSIPLLSLIRLWKLPARIIDLLHEDRSIPRSIHTNDSGRNKTSSCSFWASTCFTPMPRLPLCRMVKSFSRLQKSASTATSTSAGSRRW